MESKHALVPEWLRSTGNVRGGGSSASHFVSSSSQSDASVVQNTRNRFTKSTYDFDAPHSVFLDRTCSANSRISLGNNGSGKHAYSSFTRSHHGKGWKRENEKSSYGSRWDPLSSDPFEKQISSRVEKNMPKQSHSMGLRKESELLLRRFVYDSKNVGNGNGVISGGNIESITQKAKFEKDFPSLGIEERQGAPDAGRVSYSGFSTGVQNLLVGNSAQVGCEGWTSSLAEVLPSSAQQAAVATSGSGSPSTMAGLNMAKALALAPLRADTAPQLSVKTQRLEELAIKQSRQLIPVTPAMSKTSVFSALDKSKSKTTARTAEMIPAPKSGQQQLSSLHLSNQSPRGEHVKPDASRISHGKFLVLKPVRENGSSPSAKEVYSPTTCASRRVAAGDLSVAPFSTSPSLRSSSDLKPSTTVGHKVLNTVCTVEKRVSSSQAQSRKNFLNLLRKKSSTNAATSIPDSGPVSSFPSLEKTVGAMEEVIMATVNSQAIENGGEICYNGTTYEEAKSFSDIGEKNLNPNPVVYPDEEEAAFLRSLGWDEIGGEDEGLTEEEISAFYQEYMKLKPSLKLCGGVLSKLSMLPQSPESALEGASSGLSSSNSGSDV